MKPLVFTESNLNSDFVNGTLVNVTTATDGSLVLSPGQLTGYRVSPVFDISEAGQAANSMVSWSYILTSGTSVVVESSISFDSGFSWSNWNNIDQGGRIGGINYWTPPNTEGTPLLSVRVKFRITLITKVSTSTPSVSYFSATLDPYSISGQSMVSYMPFFYQPGRVVNALMQARGLEIDSALDTLNDVLNQLFVSTSTWKLSDWESLVGLPDGTGSLDADRRVKILAKIKGYGTATIPVIQNISSTFASGDIAVVENWEAYAIIIRFIDERGIPTNQIDMQNALRAIIPAHLTINYEYSFSIWDRWDALGLTNDMLDALVLTQDQSDTYI